MKILLFVPKVYSLAEMLKDGFQENNWVAKIIDYKELLPHRLNRFYERTAGLPKRITKYWVPKYFNIINQKYLEVYEQENPDIVLIYNNQYFYPETLEIISKKSNIVFFLGDNPLWSKTFDYNLTILKYADLILVPDSHWQLELSSIGINNIYCDYIGYSKKLFYPVSIIPLSIKEKYDSDIIFIGRNYADASGYKRTLFLNSFVGMNFKIFGTKEWNKWIPKFPDLALHFNLMTNRIDNNELNLALNCSKVYPIDQNTGIVNGIHLRVFEIIGSGVLPIVEWRKDIDTVFGNTLPVISNYNQARAIAKKYLDDEETRLHTVKKLRNLLNEFYTPSLYTARLIKRIE